MNANRFYRGRKAPVQVNKSTSQSGDDKEDQPALRIRQERDNTYG